MDRPTQNAMRSRSDRSMNRLVDMRWLVPAFTLTMLLGLARAEVAHAAGPFPDKNLEEAVRAVLKHEPKVELTDEKLLNVYVLEAPGKEIKDLTGLEKCK